VSDTVASTSGLPTWTGALLGLPLFGLMILSDHFGFHEYFWATVVSVTAFSLAIWENRSYHVEIWFWISLLLFAAIHAILVVVTAQHRLFSDVHGYNARGLIFIALVDFAIITGVIRFPDWVVSSYDWFFGDQRGERTVGK
jgi:hypothetical protein